jgi:phage-related tail protein
MSKKKGKKKHQKKVSLLKEIDGQLDASYEDLMKEIEEMQYQIYLADEKARKQAKKKKKKDKGYEFNYTELQKQARREVVSKMEGNNFLDRVMKFIEDITPIVISISRLVAALIVCILSIDTVKASIKPDTLKKMNNVYTKAMSIK